MRMKGITRAARMIATCTITAMMPLAVAAVGYGPEKPHPLAGTWSGRGEGGQQIEIEINEDASGQWCYWFANGGLASGSIADRVAEANTITWWEGDHQKDQLTKSTNRRNEALFVEEASNGARATTPLRPARSIRCLDRFDLGQEPGTETQEPQQGEGLIGTWTGIIFGNDNHIEVRIEAIDEAGMVRGRYCTEAPAESGGIMTLWDMDPKGGFRARKSKEEDRLQMAIRWPGSVNEVEMWLDEDGEMRWLIKMDARKFGNKDHRGGWLQRGIQAGGCLQRTTPKPATRTRRVAGPATPDNGK